MAGTLFERRNKEDLPVLAICYDFDHTLSPDDMQAQGFIQEVGWSVADFWKGTTRLARENDMDANLAYMLMMLEESRGKFALTRQALMDYGARVKLYPGVAEWFERIRAYGREQGVIVEHYIISSGIREMIEGTEMAKKGAFTQIYASSFYFNENDEAVWPAMAVNYTNKTQFLFRIEKGVLDVNDPAVNDNFPQEERRVPFRNMVYIGDSDTDVPCMRLVNGYGGHSIGVYDPEGGKSKVYKMLRENRIRYFAEADYRENSQLDWLLKSIIQHTAAKEQLEAFHYTLKKEVENFAQNEMKRATPETREKERLIQALSGSRNFATTHMLVERLLAVPNWTQEEREELFRIGEQNKQIYYMLGDVRLAKFYRSLLAQEDEDSLFARSIREALDAQT
ncbi:MAG: haloacid dehalogenase-like hydrolase [Lachnospiraceae bacterium]|nr:haloacid dehalogenase-like hydrolase [Lachnospiraceae bacterium]